MTEQLIEEEEVRGSDIVLPALDYDWYINHVGKHVEGMPNLTPKSLGIITYYDGSQMIVSFVNSSEKSVFGFVLVDKVGNVINVLKVENQHPNVCVAGRDGKVYFASIQRGADEQS